MNNITNQSYTLYMSEGTGFKPPFGTPFKINILNHETMKTYTGKEVWVLNKKFASIIKGLLLFKGSEPFRLITKDNSYSINENRLIYYSKSEADEALKNYKEEIKELCCETKKNIEKLDDALLSGLVKTKDYIPEDILNRNSNYRDYFDICELLTTYIQSGAININAVSFTKESVSHVNWGETAAEVVLKNGQKITTYDYVELELITRVFGGNNGERYFTTIKPEKEEDND